MQHQTSLGKPFLRKEMEQQMKAICEGRNTKELVLGDSISKYRNVYDHSLGELGTLKAVSLSFLLLPFSA
jgi:DNA topoisomerase-3